VAVLCCSTYSRARSNASNPSVCKITYVVASSETLSVISIRLNLQSPPPPSRVFCKPRLIRKFTNPNIPESQLVRISEALLYIYFF
jgi:hypothetical protein